MRYNVVEVIVGAVVLMIAAFFMIFAYQSSQWRSKEGYPLTARFDRIDGIHVGSDVKMSGVPIGVVDHISIDNQSYLAVVKLLIQPKYLIPKDSIAEVISESFLGNKSINIIAGNSDDMLNASERIFRTQSSISFESLIGKFLLKPDDVE